MKKAALILLSLTITLTAGWWRTYGGTGYEEGLCVQITSDGNYIISGTREDSLWLLKVDKSGYVLWSKVHGGGAYMRGRWVEETNDGGYIVASQRPTLVKVNTQGDTLWTKDYGIHSYCVQQTSDGNYIVVGGDKGNEFDTRLKILKINPNCDTIWSLSYGHHLEVHVGKFIQETRDGGYVITGRQGAMNEENITTHTRLVKIDSIGNWIWSHSWGETGSPIINYGYCVRETSDGGFIIVGQRAESVLGLWLLKTDSLGDTLWTKTYYTSTGGMGYCVKQTQDGGYIITGSTETLFATFNPVDCDLWLIRTDSLGDTIWTRTYGGVYDDRGYSLQKTSDGGYIVVGSTESFGAGGSDIYLLKTDSLGFLAVEEPIIPEIQPTFEVLTAVGKQIVLLSSHSEERSQLGIFDASGRLVDELILGGLGTITWGDGFSPGVYFIREMEGNPHTQKVLLVK